MKVIDCSVIESYFDSHMELLNNLRDMYKESADTFEAIKDDNAQKYYRGKQEVVELLLRSATAQKEIMLRKPIEI